MARRYMFNGDVDDGGMSEVSEFKIFETLLKWEQQY